MRARGGGTDTCGERMAEAVGLSWAVGMALFSEAYFLLYLVGAPDPVTVALSLGVAVVAVAAGLRVLRCARVGEPWSATGIPSRRSAVVAGGLAVAAAQILVASWIATHSLLRHDDAWTVWAWKARMVVAGPLPPGYFHYLVWTSHPNYPFNLSLAEALFFHLPDPLGLTLASLIGTVCLVALLLLFYAGLARLYGRGVAALATGALALVPSLPLFAGYTYADVPLALYAGASALYLLLWLRLRRPIDLALMGLLAGGAIWTKKEGLPIALLLLLAVVLGEARWRGQRGQRGRRDMSWRERVRPIVRAGVATAVLSLPWLVFTRIVRPGGSDVQPITPAVFVANVGRLPTIALYVVREALDVEGWGVFWIVVVAAVLLALRRRLLSPQGGILLLVLLGQLAVYMAGYVFSSWTPYTLHIDSSLNRLMLQAVPLALLVAVDAVRALVPRSVPLDLYTAKAADLPRETTRSAM